jgi:predicted nucleic acid-binding protein
VNYLLDTSIYSQPLKKTPIPSVVEQWKAVGDLSCCISVFCEMEVLQGLEISKSGNLYELYRISLKDRIPILPFTTDEAMQYAHIQADLVTAGRPRPVIDLCIAATAIVHNCILVTLNRKDFIDIPELRIEDWSR